MRGAVPNGMWDLSSQPGTEPMAPSVEAQSLNHWTAREVFKCFVYLFFKSFKFKHFKLYY